MSDFNAQMDLLDNFCSSLTKFSTAMTEARVVYRDMMVMQGPLVKSRYFANNKKRSSSPSTSTSRKRVKASTGNPISLPTREVTVGTKIPVVSTSKQRAKSLAGTTPSTDTRLVMDAVEIPMSTIPPQTPIQQGKQPEGKLVTSHYFPPQADATTPDTQPVLPAPPNKRKKRAQLLEKETNEETAVQTSPYFDVPAVLVAVKKKPYSIRIPLTLTAEMALPATQAPELWWEDDAIAVTRKRTIARFKSNPVLYYSVWNAKPNLVQEQVRDDTWKLLIAVMFLNKTNGRVAVPVFWEVLRRWPTAILLSTADKQELVTLITPLGLQKSRADRLIKLSKLFLDDPPSPNVLHRSRAKVDTLSYPPTPISHFPGCGPYALDSYRIFHVGPCNGPSEWKSVMPGDKELIRFLRWKWAFEEHKIWEPTTGVVRNVDEEYLLALPGLLRE